MLDAKLKIREFKSLDEFRTWWEGTEVAHFCRDYPEEVASLKEHPDIKLWLTVLENIPKPLPVDFKTFGKYTIEKKLGQGGMGVVYLAYDQILKQAVALKIMALKSESEMERFLREVRAAARLKHPNIVQVYEVGTEGQYHYFTMEYIEGHSLSALIQNEPLTPKKTAEIIRDIAIALDYAHHEGIIHRDLKPANILVTADQRVYLMDFGLAKEMAGLEKALTLSGTIMGTPDYMSPEQIRGEKKNIDARSDIFSLGATFYHALTGQTPFLGRGLYQVLERVINSEPLPLRRLVRNLPRDMEIICLKCLEKEPERRYQTAQALADDLTAYLKGDNISIRPDGLFTKLLRKTRRHKIAAFSLLGAVAAIIIVIIVTFAIASVNTRRQIAELRNNALRAYQLNNFPEALMLANQVLTHSPKDAKMIELRNECQIALDKDKQERQQREIERKQAEQEQINKQQAEELRAEAKTILDGVVDDLPPDQKIEVAKEALVKDPSFGQAWLFIGRTYKAMGKEDNALDSFRKAIEVEPSLFSAYYEKGLILAAKGLRKDAIADFSKAIEYNPKYDQAFYKRGTLYYAQGDFDLAISDFQTTILLNPEFGDAYNDIGSAYLSMDDVDTALIKYSNAITLFSGLLKSYQDKTAELVKAGKISEAMSEHNPKEDEIIAILAILYTNRGVAYQQKKQYDTALNDFTDAIKIYGRYPASYYSRAFAYAEMGDISQAVADAETLIKLFPNSAEAISIITSLNQWKKQLNK